MHKKRCTKRTWYLARIFHSVLSFVKHEPRACWIWTSTVVWKQHLYPTKLLWEVCWFGESDYHFSHVFLFQKEHWTVVLGARKTWDFPFRCVLRSYEPFQQDYFNCSSQSLKLFWTQNWDMCLKYSLVLGKLNNILLSLFPSRVLEWHSEHTYEKFMLRQNLSARMNGKTPHNTVSYPVLGRLPYTLGLAETEVIFPTGAITMLCFVWVARKNFITHQCSGYC